MIYIGQCRKNYTNYYGSAQEFLLENFYTQEEINHMIIRRDIIDTANTAKELHKKELEYILKYQSNNPAIGFNQRPPYKE